MKVFLRERADELEQMLNWVSDQDQQWWPFAFLRPEPWQRMSSLRVAALSLLLGVFFFGEPFPRARAIGFILIWCALAIYAADGLRRSRAAAQV